jgi:AraC-like DNA-binding protein
VRFNYCEYLTPAFEHDCVEAVWSFRPCKPAKYLVLPDGRVDLLARFHVGPNETVSHIRLIVAGPASRSSLVPATRHTGFLGVRFRPGWGICLGLDPKMLRDAALLDEEVRSALGLLAIPLVQAKNVSEVQQVLFNTACTLASRVQPNSRFARAANAIGLLHDCDGKSSITTLAQKAGVSVRTLHRDIVATAGLSTKLLAALFRFEHAMRILRIAPSHNLALLASEAGYSDQAHMNREFRRFGGFTPAARPDVAVINTSRT